MLLAPHNSPRFTQFCLSAPRLLLAAVLSLSLLGCSHTARKANFYRFDTLITEEGLKLFQLSYPAPKRQLLVLPVDSQRPRPASSRGPSERTLEKVLQDKLKANQYCRQGYFLLGRHAGETAQRVRGECREKATEADRKRFENSIAQW